MTMEFEFSIWTLTGTTESIPEVGVRELMNVVLQSSTDLRLEFQGLVKAWAVSTVWSHEKFW